ncbi:MAG: phosphoribosylamine--glycine ligase [Bacteroidia bacterium]
MRILILGSGGREHTLAWKLSQEIGAENVFVAPGNGGTGNCATNVDIGVNNFDEIIEFCVDNQIDTLLPGSEDPIANGIRDAVESDARCTDIFVFSPDRDAGQLEGSKEFAKKFMMRHGIPTAAYRSFNAESVEEAKAFLTTLESPYVLKADGLAAGKGVLIIENLKEAQDAVEDMLVNKKFGEASATVVIEEFLSGIEFSIFVLTDGKSYVLLPEAKDYKRIEEGDTGLNTGGMGAVSPVNFFEGEIKRKTIEDVIEPTIRGFEKDGLNYRGFVFFGLINVNGSPEVIEYNVRMGDPETEVVIPRMDESLSSIIDEARNGNMQTRAAKLKKGFCTTVFSVSGGYPEEYEKGILIDIPEHSTLFHAGTKLENGKLKTSGGRVLAATGFGDDLQSALNESYRITEQISFDKKFYRTDIGKDLMKLQENGSV